MPFEFSLSIGSGVLSLAALHRPALAEPCVGVELESPGGTTVISGNGSVSCLVIGDALLSVSGDVIPIVPLGAPTGPTTYSYDAQGRLPSETDSTGTTTNTYDGQGRVTQSIDPSNNVTTYQYDAASGRLNDIDQPAGNVTTYQYDPGTGRLTDTEGPGGRITTYQYDALDRTIAQIDLLDGTTTTTYDSSGEIVQTTDPTGHVTTYSYDGMNRLTEVTDPQGHATTYSYDAMSRLTSMTDPLGSVTTFAYDAQSRLVSDTGNSDGQTSFTYSASGTGTIVAGAAGFRIGGLDGPSPPAEMKLLPRSGVARKGDGEQAAVSSQRAETSKEASTSQQGALALDAVRLDFSHAVGEVIYASSSSGSFACTGPLSRPLAATSRSTSSITAMSAASP